MDLNLLSSVELQQKGVPPSIADALALERRQHGVYSSWLELLERLERATGPSSDDAPSAAEPAGAERHGWGFLPEDVRLLNVRALASWRTGSAFAHLSRAADMQV